MSSLFVRAGYFAGSRLHAPRDSNPAGFFESDEVNQINNRILAGQHSSNGLSGWVGVYDGPVEHLPDDVRPRIEAQTAHTPWCFKDPRFSYTLPAWEGLLGACTVLCVFRDPTAVVASLLKECAAYYPQYGMTPAMAEQIWRRNYCSVFERIEPRHRVCFVRYEDLLEGAGITALEERLGLSLEQGLVRPELNRQGGRERRVAGAVTGAVTGAATGCGPGTAADPLSVARPAAVPLSPAALEMHSRLMAARI